MRVEGFGLPERLVRAVELADLGEGLTELAEGSGILRLRLHPLLKGREARAVLIGRERLSVCTPRVQEGR